MASQFAPVFMQKENRFIILDKNFVADDREKAWEIGLGASLVECILLGLTTSRVDGSTEVVEIVDGKILHFPATLGPYNVALLSGPLFDEYTAPVSAPQETTP